MPNWKGPWQHERHQRASLPGLRPLHHGHARRSFDPFRRRRRLPSLPALRRTHLHESGHRRTRQTGARASGRGDEIGRARARLRLHHRRQRRRRQHLRGVSHAEPGSAPVGRPLRQRLGLRAGRQQHREGPEKTRHRPVHLCRRLGRISGPAGRVPEGIDTRRRDPHGPRDLRTAVARSVATRHPLHRVGNELHHRSGERARLVLRTLRLAVRPRPYTTASGLPN